MTAPDGDARAEVEVELNDALSPKAKSAAENVEDMAREVKQLNRQLLLLDKRANKAARAIAKLDAAVVAFNGNITKTNPVIQQVTNNITQYIGQTKAATKATQQFGVQTKRGAYQANRFRNSLRSLFGVVRRGAFFLNPLVIGVVSLVGVLAGGIAPAIQFVGALAAISGVLLGLPSMIAATLLGISALVVGFKGIGSGISAALSGDWQEFYDAQKDLAPSAQHFLKVIRKYRDEFSDIRMAVQEALFEPFARKLKPALLRMMPIFQDGMSRFASIFGSTIGDVLDHFASDKGARSMEVLWGNAAFFAEQFRATVGPILNGLADLVIALGPAVDMVTERMAAWGIRFGEWLTRISESGEAEEFFVKAVDLGGQLFSMLGSIFEIFGNITRAVGGASFGSLPEFLDQIAKATGDVEGQAGIARFFDAIGGVASALTPVFMSLLNVISSVAPIIADIIITLSPYIADFFNSIGSALASTAPMWGPLAEAIGQTLVAFTPLLPVLATIITTLGQGLASVLIAVAPLITELMTTMGEPLRVFFTMLGEMFVAQGPYLAQIFEMIAQVAGALTPVITQLGDTFLNHFMVFLQDMIPIWEAQMPLWAEFFSVVGLQLIEAFKQIIPMLPGLTQLFFDLLKTLTEPSTQEFIMSLLTMFLQMSTQFSTDLVPTIIFLLQWGIRLVGWLLSVASTGLEVARQVGEWIGSIIDFLDRLGDRIKEGFGDVIGAISGPFKAAFNAIASAWNSTVGQLTIPSWVPIVGGSSMPKIPFLAAGGPAVAGQDYIVGEIGPEMFFPKNGGEPFLIGQHGPEMRSFPTDGYVMPNYMVRALQQAEAGMENQLASIERVGAAVSEAKLANALARAGVGDGERHEYHITQYFHGSDMSPRDIERAVRTAIKKIEQDRKERR